ncbi:DNA replication ATP-dependent helicase/nuclease DNA2-like [Glandiceps talaboti]
MVKPDKKRLGASGSSATRSTSQTTTILNFFGKKAEENRSSKLFTTLGKTSVAGQKTTSVQVTSKTKSANPFKLRKPKSVQGQRKVEQESPEKEDISVIGETPERQRAKIDKQSVSRPTNSKLEKYFVPETPDKKCDRTVTAPSHSPSEYVSKKLSPDVIVLKELQNPGNTDEVTVDKQEHCGKHDMTKWSLEMVKPDPALLQKFKIKGTENKKFGKVVKDNICHNNKNRSMGNESTCRRSEEENEQEYKCLDVSDTCHDIQEELESMGYLVGNSAEKNAALKWQSMESIKSTVVGGHSKFKRVSWSGAVLGKRSPVKGISPLKKKQASQSVYVKDKRQSVRSLINELNSDDTLTKTDSVLTSTPVKTTKCHDDDKMLQLGSPLTHTNCIPPTPETKVRSTGYHGKPGHDDLDSIPTTPPNKVCSASYHGNPILEDIESIPASPQDKDYSGNSFHGNCRLVESSNANTSGNPYCLNTSDEVLGDLDDKDGGACSHDNSLVDETTAENMIVGSQTSCDVSDLWGSLNESMLAALDMEILDESNQGFDNKSQPCNQSRNQQTPYKQSQSQPDYDSWSEKPPFLQNCYKVLNKDYKPGLLTLQVCPVYCNVQSEKTLLLKGVWSQTLVDVGTNVCVLGDFDDTDRCTVDQNNNFVIVEPDLLLSGTSIASSIRCMRRSVLNEIFKGTDFSSKAMACGTLLHDVFQQAIITRDFSKQAVTNIIMTTIAKQPHLNNMFVLGLQESDMLETVEPYMSSIEEWANIYFHSTPSVKSKVNIKLPDKDKSDSYRVSVSDIRDIEDNIWCPRWGIKGKIDVTAEVKIHKTNTHVKNVDTLVLPLELKTGRETNSVEHRSQLILYSLMLSDFIQPDTGLGLLLYLKTGSMLSVAANHMDKRELINLRNQLAYYINKRVNTDQTSQFPDLIDDDFTCARCPQLQKCALLHRTVDKDKSQVSEKIENLLFEEVGHLQPIELEYFTKWYTMCRLEMEEVKRSVFWTKPAQKREKNGNCLSNMVMYGPVEKCIDGQFVCVFQRQDESVRLLPVSSVGILVGDRLVISLQDLTRIALCNGTVTKIDDESVTVMTEKDLSIFYDRDFTVYRLDRYDGYSMMSSSLNNLTQMLKSEPHSIHLSKLIIKKEKPEFSSDGMFDMIPKQVHETVKTILKTINGDQQRAIANVLKSKSYSLIVGMPGTGKTTTIVALVSVLMACNKSVLLTSYTHSAVDNILLKLKSSGVDFLRLGSVHKIHPDLHQYCDHHLNQDCQSLEELKQLYQSKSIVASTCLGMKHVLFSQRRFDVCIVDEASQINQMVCIGPLLNADRFVLVGDHRQLAPLVQSSKAKSMGMDESLFERLSIHSDATTELCMQYRMNTSIMDISNHLVYDGKLQCGDEQIAQRRLVLPGYQTYKQNLQSTSSVLSWLPEVIEPNLPVCFLNTDKMQASHQKLHNSLVNAVECRLVCLLLIALQKSGCDFSSIGVIAPYTKQCQLIHDQVSKLDSSKHLEVSTVDKYQGRDKDVIILSFVQSCAVKGQMSKGYGILQDIRRLNVAITRAKCKLIMIGSVSTLSNFTPLEKLISYLKTRRIISFPIIIVPTEL